MVWIAWTKEYEGECDFAEITVQRARHDGDHHGYRFPVGSGGDNRWHGGDECDRGEQYIDYGENSGACHWSSRRSGDEYG